MTGWCRLGFGPAFLDAFAGRRHPVAMPATISEEWSWLRIPALKPIGVPKMSKAGAPPQHSWNAREKKSAPRGCSLNFGGSPKKANSTVEPADFSKQSANQPSPEQEPVRFYRIAAVCDRTGISRRQVYRWVKAGRFPAQRRLSHRVAVWRSDEVDHWIRNLCGDAVAIRPIEKGAARKRPL